MVLLFVYMTDVYGYAYMFEWALACDAHSVSYVGCHVLHVLALEILNEDLETRCKVAWRNLTLWSECVSHLGHLGHKARLTLGSLRSLEVAWVT